MWLRVTCQNIALYKQSPSFQWFSSEDIYCLSKCQPGDQRDWKTHWRTAVWAGPVLTALDSHFHPCFVPLIKVLILGAHGSTVTLEFFWSRVSVLDMVQMLLALLESNPSTAVRSNCGVCCARGHLWRRAGGIPKYLLEDVTSCVSLSFSFFLMCSVTSCRCDLTPSGQTAILLLRYSLLHKGRKLVGAWDGTDLGCVLDAFAVQLGQ